MNVQMVIIEITLPINVYRVIQLALHVMMRLEIIVSAALISRMEALLLNTISSLTLTFAILNVPWGSL
jgi:hypothetical protein